jgi:hypothetical protein
VLFEGLGWSFFVFVSFGSRGMVLVGLFFFFFWAVFFFFISSFAFSLVYCRCTKGRLTLLIKSVYYLSKKILEYAIIPFLINFFINWLQSLQQKIRSYVCD